MQKMILPHFSPWRNREGLGTVFTGDQHGQMGLGLGWEVSLKVQISEMDVQAQE